ncbi:MAG: DUF4147 domain-containing protein [Deltaproteobacteria bacterium]|nr:DUF4147 domain-containing protein [Deltaproteobacteria bacterium]
MHSLLKKEVPAKVTKQGVHRDPLLEEEPGSDVPVADGQPEQPPASRREQLRAIFAAAVAAVAPEACLGRHLARRGDLLRIGGEHWELSSIRQLVLLGAGKASVRMAAAALEQLGDRVGSGLVVAGETGACASLPPFLEVVVGAHPVPSAASVRAGKALRARLAELDTADRFIFLLSGGASALVELPAAGITLADLQRTTRLLLSSGAAIGEVNALRKHLSQVKGGQLGAVGRAAGAVLVLSDVVGDDLSAIGSGPFYPDDSTYGDCLRLIERYSLGARLPSAVIAVLRAGAAGLLPETPKQPWPQLRHHLVGSNRLALQAAADEAAELGLAPLVHHDPLQGEARQVAVELVERVLAAPPPVRPTCHLFGGETTVTVRGLGRGGRNQELALAALLALRGRPELSLLAAGTDGIDGGSDAAGAFADARAWRAAAIQGLDPATSLADNDSHTFFSRIGAQLCCGPTGTNVADLVAIVREGASES